MAHVTARVLSNPPTSPQSVESISKADLDRTLLKVSGNRPLEKYHGGVGGFERYTQVIA